MDQISLELYAQQMNENCLNKSIIDRWERFCKWNYDDIDFFSNNHENCKNYCMDTLRALSICDNCKDARQKLISMNSTHIVRNDIDKINDQIEKLSDLMIQMNIKIDNLTLIMEKMCLSLK